MTGNETFTFLRISHQVGEEWNETKGTQHPFHFHDLFRPSILRPAPETAIKEST